MCWKDAPRSKVFHSLASSTQAERGTDDGNKTLLKNATDRPYRTTLTDERQHLYPSSYQSLSRDKMVTENSVRFASESPSSAGPKPDASPEHGQLFHSWRSARFSFHVQLTARSSCLVQHRQKSLFTSSSPPDSLLKSNSPSDPGRYPAPARLMMAINGRPFQDVCAPRDVQPQEKVPLNQLVRAQPLWVTARSQRCETTLGTSTVSASFCYVCVRSFLVFLTFLMI